MATIKVLDFTQTITLRAGEKQTYTFDLSDWNSGTPSTAVAALYSRPNDTNVTATNLSGSCVISTTNITTPYVQALTAGVEYYIRITVTYSDGTILIPGGDINCIK